MKGQNNSIATEALFGAIAGITATVAMTLAANALFKHLPESERYPLPPRELTELSAAAVHLDKRLDEPALKAATVASHFGFGAASGCIFPLIASGARLNPIVGGAAYGISVWLASYLGWIPALGLLRPATRHPARRNALMIAAHLVWGATLGLVSDRLGRATEPVSGGPLRDR